MAEVKTKVLFVIDTLELGGAELSMLQMIPHFNNIELSICHLYKGSRLKADYEAQGVTVHSFGLQGPYSFYKAYTKLCKLLKQVRPNVVHVALLRSSLVCRLACRRMNIALIGSFVADSYSPSRYSQLTTVARLKLRLFQGLDRVTAKWCNHFVAISKSIAENNAKVVGLDRQLISVVYRGRDPEQFMPRQVTSWKNRSVNAIVVGRLVVSKGHRDLVAVMADTNLKDQHIHITVVGDGPEMNGLKKSIADNSLQSRFTFLGKREDVPNLLASSDLFLFPSHYEGLGGALIEAMLTGLPIVCSDIPVFREFIHEGNTGLLASVGSVDSWQQKINWIMEHETDARAMGQRARKTALTLFDIRQISYQYEKIYRTVYESYSTSN